MSGGAPGAHHLSDRALLGGTAGYVVGPWCLSWPSSEAYRSCICPEEITNSFVAIGLRLVCNSEKAKTRRKLELALGTGSIG